MTPEQHAQIKVRAAQHIHIGGVCIRCDQLHPCQVVLADALAASEARAAAAEQRVQRLLQARDECEANYESGREIGKEEGAEQYAEEIEAEREQMRARVSALEAALREIEQTPYTLAGGTDEMLDQVLEIARRARLAPADDDAAPAPLLIPS